MPHRIKWLTEAHYQDPLVDYGSTEFVLQFENAADLLQKWRNPKLGRSSREGTVIRLANEANRTITTIENTLLTTSLDEKTERDLIEQLKILNFMLNFTLPEALELINTDQLLSIEDVLKFIQKHLNLMQQEIQIDVGMAQGILNQLKDITDIEIKDQFGRSRKVNRDEVLDVLGRTLANLIIRQSSLRPVDQVDIKPRGKLLLKETFKAAVLRTSRIPPDEVISDDIRVVNQDRLSLIYFIVDVSQSMSIPVFSGGLTRLDGALLTSLGMFYYFNTVNRRKRRSFDTFKMHLVPVTKLPYVIEDKRKLEDFLYNAEAKGKTRLVHALNAVHNHVKSYQKNNDFDVQVIVLTDGRPNVPFEGRVPGVKNKFLNEYLNESTTNVDTKTCMLQLNQFFNYLKRNTIREWDISYFLMAPEKFRNSDLFKDTQVMLTGITKPVLVDPTQIEKLGATIIRNMVMG